MKKQFRKFVSLVLAGLIVTTMLPAEAVRATEIVENDAIEEILEIGENTEIVDTTKTAGNVEIDKPTDGLNSYGFGGMDAGFEVGPLHGTDEYILGEGDNIPTSYTISDNGCVSSVRNQANFDSCWAMATIACAEGEALNHGLSPYTNEDINFSENHLINFTYRKSVDGPDGGLTGDKSVSARTGYMNAGNLQLSGYTLMSWEGVADENTDSSLAYPTLPASITNRDKINEWYNNYEPRIDDSLAYKDVMHLQSMYTLPGPDASCYYMDEGEEKTAAVESYDLAKEEIKKRVMDVKGVAILYRHGNKYYGEYEGSPAVYYYPQQLYEGQIEKTLREFDTKSDSYTYEDKDYITSDTFGHVVTIVGWDDSFDKNNFRNTKGNRENKEYPIRNKEGNFKTSLWVDQNDVEPFLPKENGAWLCKNSWGTERGNDGFFWMSYESVKGNAYVAFDYESADNYDHNYQYDGTGNPYSISLPNNTKVANIFTIGNGVDMGQQVLEAVSVGTFSHDLMIDVQVYKDPTDESNPESGKLISEVKDHYERVAGYYTIKLDKQPVLDAGTKIAVVATLKAQHEDSVSPLIDGSVDLGWINFVNEKNNGETLIAKKSNGVYVWSDPDELDEVKSLERVTNVNARIKAYTSDVDGGEDQKTFIGKADISVVYPKNKMSYTYTGEAITPNVKAVLDEEELVEDVDYTLSYRNNINTGKATIIVQGLGDFGGSTKLEFDIDKKLVKASDFTMALRVSVSGNDAKPYLYYKDKLVDRDCYEVVSVKEGKKLSTATETTLENVEKGKKYCITFKFRKNFKLNAADSKNLVIQGCECSAEAERFSVEIVEGTRYVSENCIYNGKLWKPTVSVKYGEGDDQITLPKGKYTVKYYNNKSAGTALIVVKGKGIYKNCLGTANFTIKKRKLETSEVTIKTVKSRIVFNGKSQTPKLKVTYKDGNRNRVLKLTSDYRTGYKNTKNAGENTASSIVKLSNNFEVTKDGASVSGNTVSKKFSIEKAKLTSYKVVGTYNASDVSADGKYVGKPIETKVKAGKISVSSDNYTVEVSEIKTNTAGKPIKMVITIKAKDKTNFTGEKRLNINLK